MDAMQFYEAVDLTVGSAAFLLFLSPLPTKKERMFSYGFVSQLVG